MVFGELKKLDTLAEMENFLNSELEILNTGSGRIVYKYSDTLVIKLAKNEAGMEQNKVESEVKGFNDICGIIYRHDKKYRWVLMEKLSEIDEGEFCNSLKIHPEAFKWFIEHKYFVLLKDDSTALQLCIDNCSKHSEAIKYLNDDLRAKRIIDLMVSHKLEGGDISRYGSWGKRSDGSIALFDYGLSGHVWTNYYRVREENIDVKGGYIRKRIVEPIK